MPKSVLQAQAILNAMRGTAMPAWTPRIALFVGDPLAGGVEVSGGSYARQTVTFGAPAVGSNLSSSSAIVTFPTPTGLWGVLTHFALMDAATGGNVRYAYLMSGSDDQRTVGVGSPPVVLDIGTILVTEL